MGELEEVVTYDDLHEVMGEYVEAVTDGMPSEEQLQELGDSAAQGAADAVTEQLAETVTENNDVIVSQVSEAVASNNDDLVSQVAEAVGERLDDSVGSTVTATIDQAQYDEIVAAYRNASTLMFLQVLFTAMLIGVMIYQHFRGQWG